MTKIEHIGIAVKNLEQANELFRKLFGKPNYKTESVEAEKVSTSFYQMGESKIELLEASDPESAISKSIAARGEGLHHIAIAVDNITEEMKRLKGEGFIFTREEPFRGADNKLVCFLHPKSTNGVLVELCQEIR